jgi:dihydroorotase
VGSQDFIKTVANTGTMAGCAGLVLKNVTLPGGRIADLSLDGGYVVHAGAGIPSDRSIDCSGLLVLPGATDIHVHMRGGSQSQKEDWATGSRSALAGGVTLVVDQPNTIPPLATPEAFGRRLKDASEHAACSFAINSAITRDTDIVRMWKAGAMAFGETFFGPSSYGEAVDPATLERSFAAVNALGGLVTVHAENATGRPEACLADHDRARPASGENEAIRAVRERNRSGCRLHFCHLSTAGALAAAGEVSSEVTPHHLFLSTDSFRDPEDTCGKVNPPLRTEKERRDLWTCWDKIPIIASDHAPHTRAEKRAPFAAAPSGIPGVETMMPLLAAKVLNRTITAASLINKTSTNPALLLGIQKAGFSIRDRADFALYPKAPVRVRADDLHSRCGWTPFEGMPAAFPATVIMGGEVVYRNGDFFTGSPRWFPGKGHRSRPSACKGTNH